MPDVYLLTGSPGTGKTTAIREAIAKTNARAGGFYTEEIRSGGARKGFRIKTLDGREGILAHVEISSPHRVSRYGVDTTSLDEIGVNAIHQAIKEKDLIVIDEIGKMELFSPYFQETVLQAINSSKKVLGTIMLNPNPFADKIKLLPNMRVIEINRQNYKQVLAEITSWIELTANENKP